MERAELYFLNTLRAALLGEAAEPSGLTPEEWATLPALAQSHHVLPLFFEAVHSLPEAQNSPAFPTLRSQVRRQVIGQTQKTCLFLALYGKLREAGLRPLVVKGLVCRNLYPHPDHRSSSDEDLLISPEQFDACLPVLAEFGLRTDATPEELEHQYEIPFRSETSPLYIELHRSLFPPESEAYGDLNRFFEGVHDRAVEVLIQGVPVCTMAPTDHLFYLICHAFKHFLHSGFGIRQVCDIVMYANAYGPLLDWAELLDRCRLIRADRFAAAIFKIGKDYLVFDPARSFYPPAWQDIPVDEEPMLADLLSGGVYGGATQDRKHSSSITLDAVAARNQGRPSRNGLMLSLFPPARHLEGRYPYLKDRPWLLPAAWVSRFAAYRRESGSGTEALRIANQRLELLKEYGIIE